MGYRIVVATMDKDGNLNSPKVFADGWLQNEESVLGRPVDVQFLKDGSMLVSDAIYRISYKG